MPRRPTYPTIGDEDPTPSIHRRREDTDNSGADQRAEVTPRTSMRFSLRDVIVVLTVVIGSCVGYGIAWASLKGKDAATELRVDALERHSSELATKGDLRELKQWLRLCILSPKECER